MTNITPYFIECKKTEFSCKIGKLAADYSDNLCVGNFKKIDLLQDKLTLAYTLFKILCFIKLFLNEETNKYEDRCIDNKDILNIIKQLDSLLDCYSFDCEQLPIEEEGLETSLEGGLEA